MTVSQTVRPTFAAASLLVLLLPLAAHADRGNRDHSYVRAAAPEGAIKHILVINIENEGESATYGGCPANPPAGNANYLNCTLVPQGEFIVNYYATSHVSLGNYIAEVSGQETNPTLNSDCIDAASLSHPPVVGQFTDISPGTDADTSTNPQFAGQVLGDGCVFPKPTATTHGAQTIGDQLDHARNDGHEGEDDHVSWREYAEDMGNDVSRDFGTLDRFGGTDCAHPAIGTPDLTNSAQGSPIVDQYADRHAPFVYFHSVIDDQKHCNRHVVPLGTVLVGLNGNPDTFSGHLYEDLQRIETTPKFMFVTPNLCNDGHDATCAGPNVEGTTNAAGKNIGGLVGVNLWLAHWMPMIMASPAYRSGKLLVVITTDESGSDLGAGAAACPNAVQSACLSPSGPNLQNPGWSPLLGLFIPGYPKSDPAPFTLPGGGQVGALLLNKHLIVPGSVNSTGTYNHYSALRSYEDLLGVTEGGDDGHGHLGYAATAGMLPFGKDVFNALP
jgi:phosphatidylinositol-3-phosphatase